MSATQLLNNATKDLVTKTAERIEREQADNFLKAIQKCVSPSPSTMFTTSKAESVSSKSEEEEHPSPAPGG
ncbi:hypothetical protein C2L91_03380 [Coxiella burnetii]|uniref:CBU_0113 family Dot/Icm T4SS effector n=1 Tax=Coxiella burnetii TaxID=777 RepID=UPI000CCC74A7|nr:CBU_0113 family Dot/Icm T4SS effector [Coxiella burnetii]PNT81754.1 hypothetical protein C2L91_03380 [Coxiella burnetii]